MDTVVIVLLRVLEVLFLVGVVGCVIAIPITAARMFAVLFEQDAPDQNGRPQAL